jgi:hypothetical protein
MTLGQAARFTRGFCLIHLIGVTKYEYEPIQEYQTHSQAEIDHFGRVAPFVTSVVSVVKPLGQALKEKGSAHYHSSLRWQIR